MSAQPAKPQPPKGVIVAPRKITLEDVRRKAEHVQQTAKDDVKRAGEQVMDQGNTRLIMYAAVGVVVAVGVAYYLGNRAAARAAARALPAPPLPPA